GCLEADTLCRLREQDRLVQTVFPTDAIDNRVLQRCTEPVHDDRRRKTDCWIVAADEDLAVAESRVLAHWLAEEHPQDIRYLFRQALHSDIVQRDYGYVFLDCPPRLTTACINALLACDYILVPVILDRRSTEGAPRLLRWVRDRRASLFPHLLG